MSGFYPYTSSCGGGESMVDISGTDIEHPVEVVDDVVPVFSGNFLLCEVRATHL